MLCTLTHIGTIRVDEEYYHEYTVICDNGIVFNTREEEYYRSGTRLDIADDMCMEDSGWVHWQCEKCTMSYWYRSRPGGKVICPICGAEETIPFEIKMLPFEGAGEVDRLIEDNET